MLSTDQSGSSSSSFVFTGPEGVQLVDGEIITQSVAILLTLDERHREAELLPAPGSKDKAQALRWMVFLAAEMYPMVEMTDYPERLKPSSERNQGHPNAVQQRSALDQGVKYAAGKTEQRLR